MVAWGAAAVMDVTRISPIIAVTRAQDANNRGKASHASRIGGANPALLKDEDR